MTVKLIIIAFILSLVISFYFIRLGLRGFFLDDMEGIQKRHYKRTPRSGGIAIALGVFCGGFFLPDAGGMIREFYLIMLGALPIFWGGVIEDYTKKTSPLFRLFLALFATAIVFFVLDVRLSSVKIYLFDYALSFPIISFLFTLFAVSGLANSINIIDGNNGLAGMVSLLILSALLYLTLKFQDFFLFDLCVLTIGALIGFLIWNYPHGLIFLGDSGAYFIGFIIAVISIMLVNSHPQVSPWFPLLICIYPVWETVFSMFRRRILRNKPMTQADALHLHTLIHRRVTREVHFNQNDVITATLRNSMTSVYLWMLALCSIVPAVIFWDNTLILGLFVLAFIVFYLWLYSKIIRFETPRLLRIARR